jgi:hypothetical protein
LLHHVTSVAADPVKLLPVKRLKLSPPPAIILAIFLIYQPDGTGASHRLNKEMCLLF